MITPESFFQSLIGWGVSHGIKVGCILIVAFVIGQLGKIFIGRVVRKAIASGDGESEKKREDTLISIFSSSFKFSVWIIAVITILPEFGVNIAPLLAGAGLLGLAVGLGARSLIQDYLSGIFIILEDQYRVGDSVKIAELEGVVKEITLRRTILQDKRGVVHSIPNGQASVSSNKPKR